MASKCYPRLSTIISPEKLPEQIGFLRSVIAETLDKLYFRNLKVNYSLDKSTVSYDLDLICYKELKFEIPGTDGLALLLNHGDKFTVLPVSLTFTLGIKRYISNFNLAGFSFTPQSFLNDIIFKIIPYSDLNY